ncbi:ATP-binding cassette domain-containing protein [Pelagibacterium sp.]|uniref:ATP-binding cassette domain-containing protein n=1 Tax=Pelagibacterium sp. TaxID=1967288 RepID=UPI003A8E8355
MNIEIENLSVSYGSGLFSRSAPVKALDQITLSIPAGSTMGIVGESGSGKSTLGRVLLRMLPPDAGAVSVGGKNLYGLRGSSLGAFRRNVQAVFQDSGASLNPRQNIGASIAEGLDIHRIGTVSERHTRLIELLEG